MLQAISCGSRPPLVAADGIVEPYDIEEYVDMFKKVCDELDLNALEGSPTFRNETIMLPTQTRAIYGRVLTTATHFILNDIAKVKKGSVVVDLGHGAGNFVIQAAYTMGCESRGLEIMAPRHNVAKALSVLFQKDHLMPHGGSIHLKHGDITDPQHREFLTNDADLVFFNNYNEIMGTRSNPNEKSWSVEDIVAGLLTQLKPGAKLVAFSKLRRLPPSITMANDILKCGGFLPTDDVSFYELHEYPAPPGIDNFTFKNDITLYVYTRCGLPAFLCTVPNCYFNTNPIPAFLVDEKGPTKGMLLTVTNCPKHRTRSTRRMHKASTSAFVHNRHNVSPSEHRSSMSDGGYGKTKFQNIQVVTLLSTTGRSSKVVTSNIIAHRKLSSNALSTVSSSTVPSTSKVETKRVTGHIDLCKASTASETAAFVLLAPPEIEEKESSSAAFDITMGQECKDVMNKIMAASNTAGDAFDVAMPQELIDLTKHKNADPKRYRTSKAVKCCTARSEIGKRNALTWKGANRVNVPSTVCMRRLLFQLGLDTNGIPDTLRRRFKTNIKMESVSFHDDHWFVNTPHSIASVPLEPYNDEDAEYIPICSHRGRQSFANSLHSTASVQLLPPAWMDINMECETEQSGVKDDTGLQQRFMNSVVLFTSCSQRTMPDEGSCSRADDEGSCSRADDEGSVSRSKGIMPNVEPPNPVENAIKLVHKYLYSQTNNHVVANGASTYAEIRKGGVFKMVDAIKTMFMTRLNKAEAAAFRVIDLGAGLGTTLAHIAQMIPGEYVGIEYDPMRALQFLTSFERILINHPEGLCNTKIAYAIMDIVALDLYDCDLVYTYDEAFPRSLFDKVLKTFVASPRCKFMIMFKAAKASKGYRELQRQLKTAGLKEVFRLLLQKKGSGEQSNAMFLIKENQSNQTFDRMLRSKNTQLSSCLFWENCKPFWSNKETVRKAVAKLKTKTAALLDGEKKRSLGRRVIDPVCGADSLEQCARGCKTCNLTFRHLPLKQLFNADSSIAGQGLFTAVPIAKTQMIIRFDGTKGVPQERCDGFTLQLDKQTWITPKGKHRYVNHSCEPNAEFMKWTTQTKKLRVSIVALHDIAKGDEILVHYGAHHDLAKGHQPCCCNAPHCAGRKAKQMPALKTKKQKL